MFEKKKFYTAQEAANYVGCSVNYIYYLIGQGFLTRYQKRKRRYVSKEDLDQFFNTYERIEK